MLRNKGQPGNAAHACRTFKGVKPPLGSRKGKRDPFRSEHGFRFLLQLLDSAHRRAVKDSGKVHIYNMELQLCIPSEPVAHFGLLKDLFDLIEHRALRLFRFADIFVVDRLFKIKTDIIPPFILRYCVRQQRLRGHLPDFVRSFHHDSCLLYNDSVPHVSTSLDEQSVN